MKRVLVSLVALSSMLMYSPAHAELNSGRMLILNHTYLPGNCTPSGSTCPETLPVDPTNHDLTWVTMTAGGSLVINNLEPGIDSCAPGDMANCHTMTADRLTGTGEPYFDSTFLNRPFIPPGNAGNLDINATLAVNTTYRFHCRVHPAMHGVLHIVAN